MCLRALLLVCNSCIFCLQFNLNDTKIDGMLPCVYTKCSSSSQKLMKIDIKHFNFIGQMAVACAARQPRIHRKRVLAATFHEIRYIFFFSFINCRTVVVLKYKICVVLCTHIQYMLNVIIN